MPPPVSDELLVDQLVSIMYTDPDEPTSEERSLACAVIVQALEDISSQSYLSEDALEWVRTCDRTEGGFGWYAGKLGRKPEQLREMVLAWVARGCVPLDAERDRP